MTLDLVEEAGEKVRAAIGEYPVGVALAALGATVDLLIMGCPENDRAFLRTQFANTLLIREKLEQALATEH